MKREIHRFAEVTEAPASASRNAFSRSSGALPMALAWLLSASTPVAAGVEIMDLDRPAYLEGRSFHSATDADTVPQAGLPCGDANDDGKVTTTDALAALRTSVGSGFYSLSRCDVTDDGSINTSDALRILRRSVGQNIILTCPVTMTTTTTTTTTLPSLATMTWRIADTCPDSRGLYVRLFDVDNYVVYPSPSQVYVIPEADYGDVIIQCEAGAKICFGAEDDEVGIFSWGLGIGGQFGCESCCFPCVNGAFRTNNLTCGVVRWTLADYCNDGFGIQFRLFDVDHDLVSPSDPESVWVLDGYADRSSVSMACLPEAQICFGAEPRPPDGSYWGVGIYGSEGCDACCLTCPSTGLSSSSTNLICD